MLFHHFELLFSTKTNEYFRTPRQLAKQEENVNKTINVYSHIMENAEKMVQNVLGKAKDEIRNFSKTRRVVSRVFAESFKSVESSQKVYGYNFNFLENPQMVDTIKTYKNSHKPIELSLNQTFANLNVHLGNNYCYLECIKRLKSYLEETKDIKYDIDGF